MRKFFVILLLFFSYFAYSQNNIYRSGGISQTIGPPTYTPGTGGNVVAIDTLTGEWYVNPNRLSGASWLSAGYRLTNISGSVSPLYTPTKFQSRLVINAVDSIYYYNGSAWKHVNKAGGPAGGDLSGTYPNPTVSKIQGRSVSSTAPSNGQVLTYNTANARWEAATVADQSATNEGIVGVSAGSATTSVITSNTSGANGVTVSAGTGISLSETTSTNGGTITVTNSAPDQTVSITNGGGVGVTGSYPSFTLTATDQSVTNELQTIDTFSLSGQTLRASLLNDGVAASSITLPVTNVTAGTGISVSSATGNYTVTNSAPDQTVSISNGGGVGVTGSYPSFTLTAADQSITNEIQRIDTLSLSGQTLRASLLNDGVAASSVTLPIVDVVAGTNVTVTKSNGVATVSATGGGGGGISDLNGLTASTQTFATGTTGTNFNISSSTSTHTFNLPTASATNRGALSSADWTAFSNKIGGSGTANQLAYYNGASSITGSADLTYDGTKLTLGNAKNLTLGVSGTNTRSSIFPTSFGDNLPVLAIYPSSGTDVTQSISIIPRGAGANVALKAQISVNNTDIIADANNVEFLSIRAGGSSCRIATGATGTGTLRPFLISAGAVSSPASNTNQLWLLTSGRIAFNSATADAQVQINGSSTNSSDYSLIVTNSGGSTTTPAICAQNNQKVGIGTNSVDSGATLEVDGTTGGILFPRLTTTQRDALTPVNGLVIYNSTTNKLQVYAGGAWVDLH